MTDPVLIKKNYPNLLSELEKKDSDEFGPQDLAIEITASGLPVLKIRGLYIHSPRDPVREAKRQAEAANNSAGPEADNTPVIILGFGFGYSAMAAAEDSRGKPNGRPIIIVEKRRELLRLALESRDLAPFLLNNKVIFVIGKSDQIMGALSLLGNNQEKPIIIKNRALISFDEDWYREAENSVKTWNQKNDVNRATLKRFGRRWVRNLSQNLTSIRDIPGVSRLKDILKQKDIPVFLAAAGPTLDKTGPIMREIAKRCLIIAVDTSLRFILGTGIEPDFVVSLDPQYWNFRHLDRTLAGNSCLIAESAVYPPCLRHPFRAVFLCGSLFPLGRFIEDRVDPKGEVGAGGSVATAAWDFGRILGASLIWIGGLDLSYPNLKTHFRGALFEEKSHAQSFRLSPGETWSVKALRDGGSLYAKSASGGHVLTDQRLSLYAAWFENRFRMFPEVRNYSFSADGIAIKGLETGFEEQLLSLPTRRQEINALLENVFTGINCEFHEKTTQKRAGNYENSLKLLINGLNEIKNIAIETQKFTETWYNRCKNGIFSEADGEKILKRLDEANQSIMNSAVKEVAGFLFPDISEFDKSSLPETAAPLLKHLEFSKSFYKALSDAAGYNLKFLKN